MSILHGNGEKPEVVHNIRKRVLTIEGHVVTQRRARECVRPNKGFMEQLRTWERECQDKRLDFEYEEEVHHCSGRSMV